MVAGGYLFKRKMEKLKTFNDIDVDDENTNLSPDFGTGVNALQDATRKEAINWIKGLNNPNRHYPEIVAYRKEPREAIVNWIKHFFKITEEDLK